MINTSCGVFRKKCETHFLHSTHHYPRFWRCQEVDGLFTIYLSTVDEYTAESCFFIDEQFDVKIKNELLAKAIETLTERKKEVIFLSYFQGMSDAAIARKLNLVRSTVCEHRTRSLEMLKNTMEEYGYENYR